MNLKLNTNLSYPSVITQQFYSYSLFRRPSSSCQKPSKSAPPAYISPFIKSRSNILSSPTYTCALVVVPISNIGTTTRYAILNPDAAVVQDVGATALVLGGGYALVSAFDFLTRWNLVSKNLSRKLVHIISGLLFIASWPLFSCSINARYFASFAPLANAVKLLVHGLSLVTDESLIKSVTREGKPEELLRGPLYYVLILASCALLFWRESPVGLLSVSMMSAGDGVADIMGRKFGNAKIPYNSKKSWVGSISMFAFGFFISIGMLYYFSMLGYFQFEWDNIAKIVALVSFTATVVESLPISEFLDDNISVPLVTMLASYICFCL